MKEDFLYATVVSTSTNLGTYLHFIMVSLSPGTFYTY